MDNRGEVHHVLFMYVAMYNYCNTALFALTFIQAVKVHSNSDAHSMLVEVVISDGSSSGTQDAYSLISLFQ